ncbi:MAG: Zn-ribbon domain-containing OB-fold protein [Oscillospiraceae bacterium]
MYNLKYPILKTYYDALNEGKILAMKCTECGSYEYPPVPTCNNCSCMDMEWAEISGDAICYDFGPVRGIFGAYGHMEDNEFGMGLIRLKEGPEMTNMILGINQANWEEYHKKLPLTLKAEIIELDGLKQVAWRIVE